MSTSLLSSWNKGVYRKTGEGGRGFKNEEEKNVYGLKPSFAEVLSVTILISIRLYVSIAVSKGAGQRSYTRKT